MQPKIELLSSGILDRILDEAYALLMKPGIKVQSEEARKLLANAGATIDEANEIAHIPEHVARKALETVPHEFYLHNRFGEPVVRYGGDAVHFDPGSSGVHVMDPDTFEHRPSYAPDLVKVIKLTEMLPVFAAQSTAIVCNEIPKDIGDLYRLFLVLTYSNKPMITGAFSIRTLQIMFDMLTIFAGSREALAEKPQAVFDVCPSPPLIWSNFGSQNLIELARAGVPAQIVSMPLAGAAAPVTLLGAVVQHAAECISGMTIHQLAKPGSPIVWGGAPAIFDMRQGTTPMGAVETAMIDISYAQVGKSLGFPTHTYLGASDAKIVDAQAGMESGMTALIGALGGINMISGPGMLDFLACMSPEKLVVDAEAIGMVFRLLDGMHVLTDTLAIDMFEGIQFKGDFLKQKVTKQLFSKEQFLPSPVIDRGSIRAWQASGSNDTFTRAKTRTKELLAAYQQPAMSAEQEKALLDMVSRLAREAGIENLPGKD
ncbi:MAG: trimethylamine methyltransferase family protein [Anaerolineales bacterium]|nr:trimethylamine methyltransferase family protein [Anaerolineales bacterium]